ncbi:MAG: glucoronyl hydrolase, partial [Blautia sp.]|nr:glucoronyl hydrolase [Blautia sp.]
MNTKWIDKETLLSAPMLDRETASSALFSCIDKVDASLDSYKGLFPGPASEGLFYRAGENRGWTTGFFTGEVWLSFENMPE